VTFNAKLTDAIKRFGAEIKFEYSGGHVWCIISGLGARGKTAEEALDRSIAFVARHVAAVASHSAFRGRKQRRTSRRKW